MFTGLVQEVGTIFSVEYCSGGSCVCLAVSDSFLTAIKIGDSVLVNGVCSTVVAIVETGFTVDYLPETLKCSTLGLLVEGASVNLELCMRPTDRFGGHYVSGHVDVRGSIVKLMDSAPWGELVVSYDADFGNYLIPKGSICVDGVSLTLVRVEQCVFSCALIPHTFKHTIFAFKREGDLVNLEFDIVGKYLYKFTKGVSA